MSSLVPRNKVRDIAMGRETEERGKILEEKERFVQENQVPFSGSPPVILSSV